MFAVINNDKQVNEYTLPQNEQGEFGIFFGNYTYDGKTKAASENGVLVGPSNCGYDRFNIYAWKDNEITTMNPYLVRYETNNWVYDGINSQEMQYFARGSQQYDFTGVISNGTETVDGINVNVTGVKAFLDNTLELDTPDEFLFSNVSVDKNNYSSIVPIVFNHVNSKMYIGFASDRDDTEILDYVPGTPEIPATDDIEEITDTWFNLKRDSNSNVDGSPTKLKGPGETTYTDNAPLPEALLAEIKSYYSVNGGEAGNYNLNQGTTAWPSNEIRTLRIVKDIPNEYKITVERTDGKTFTFFDGFKYLKDNGYDIQPKNTGGKPDVWHYILLDAYVNGSSYTVVGFNWAVSKISAYINGAWDYNYPTVDYTIEVTPGTPAVPATQGIEGIRVFSVDIENDKFVVANHTSEASAVVNSTCTLTQTATETLISFSKPTISPVAQFANSSDAVSSFENCTFSPSVYYALPVENPAEGYVVKFSYTYNGVNYYDARVHIPANKCNFQQGKMYKYVIYITSETNGTTNPVDAETEKDEVDTNKNSITFSVGFVDYSTGNKEVIVL